MPAASVPGLTKATAASGHTVPVRSATDGNDQGEDIDANDQRRHARRRLPGHRDPRLRSAPDTGDAPTAGTHGAAVSAVAQAPDTTPDTNHGADVSAVARDNHGQATAAAQEGGPRHDAHERQEAGPRRQAGLIRRRDSDRPAESRGRGLSRSGRRNSLELGHRLHRRRVQSPGTGLDVLAHLLGSARAGDDAARPPDGSAASPGRVRPSIDRGSPRTPPSARAARSWPV